MTFGFNQSLTLRPVKSRVLRIILLVLGTLSLATGIAGIVLPLLPTTPFLLFTAFCYARSSEKFYSRLITHRIFGVYIGYYTGDGMPVRARIITILLLWVVIGISALFMVHTDYIRAILLIVAVFTTLLIVWMRPRPWEKKKSLEPLP